MPAKSAAGPGSPRARASFAACGRGRDAAAAPAPLSDNRRTRCRATDAALCSRRRALRERAPKRWSAPHKIDSVAESDPAVVAAKAAHRGAILELKFCRENGLDLFGAPRHEGSRRMANSRSSNPAPRAGTLKKMERSMKFIRVCFRAELWRIYRSWQRRCRNGHARTHRRHHARYARRDASLR